MERCVNRAAVQGVDLSNLVGYKMVRSPEEFEFVSIWITCKLILGNKYYTKIHTNYCDHNLFYTKQHCLSQCRNSRHVLPNCC